MCRETCEGRRTRACQQRTASTPVHSCSRPALGDLLRILPQKLHAPTKADFKQARGVVAFLLSTDELGLTYNGNKPKALEGSSDVDWAGDLTTHRSTSGFVFFKNNAAISGFVFFKNNAAISWPSQLQPTVAHSTANAEYCALSDAGKGATVCTCARSNVL